MVKRCGTCDSNVTNQEPHISCDACKLPFHKKCTSLADAEFDVMAMKKSNLKWFCRLCDPAVSDILSNFDKLKKYSSEIKSYKEDVDKKLSDFSERLKSCEQAKNSSPEISSVVKQLVNENLPEQNMDTEEKNLIEKKKYNLIYFRVPESSSGDNSERMKHDFESIRKLYEPGFLKSSHISNLFRVGKKSNNARPLVVKFTDIQTKNTIKDLSFGKKLTLKTNQSEILEISVSHDRTPKQREYFKKLHDELAKQKRESGDDTLVIRNGKIVRDFPSDSRREKPTWASVARML